ncbi:MAG: hypothetical protein J7L88_05680 [Thermoplasmata archaeon]|nr:hypothetical protein [Thermoplasmata archaeon]
MVRTTFRTERGGVILAKSYCNVHGLWTNSEKLEL